MCRAALVAIAIVFLTLSLAAADMMYEWVDEKGGVTLKDTPPPTVSRQKRKTFNHSTLIPTPSRPRSRPGKSNAVKASTTVVREKKPFTGTVEIYYTTWCGVSRRALAYLNEKQIPYIGYDIDKDGAAHQRYKEFGAKGVPLIIIGSHRMNGFSPESLQSYLSDGGE